MRGGAVLVRERRCASRLAVHPPVADSLNDRAIGVNSPRRTRTFNLAVNSRPLYQLSYRGSCEAAASRRGRGDDIGKRRSVNQFRHTAASDLAWAKRSATADQLTTPHHAAM